MMEKSIGEKWLTGLRLNEVGGECPEREIASVRFHFKCLEQTLFRHFTDEERETEQGRDIARVFQISGVFHLLTCL